MTILFFNLDYFQKTTNDKIFQKIQKTLVWGYFGPFFPKFGQKWTFLEKRALPVFKYSNYPSSYKTQKKTNEKECLGGFPKIPLQKRISESPD